MMNNACMDGWIKKRREKDGVPRGRLRWFSWLIAHDGDVKRL